MSDRKFPPCLCGDQPEFTQHTYIPECAITDAPYARQEIARGGRQYVVFSCANGKCGVRASAWSSPDLVEEWKTVMQVANEVRRTRSTLEPFT